MAMLKFTLLVGGWMVGCTPTGVVVRETSESGIMGTDLDAASVAPGAEDGAVSRMDGTDARVDADPDGSADASVPCYLDWDGDGVGAGEPVDCSEPYVAPLEAGMDALLDAGSAGDAGDAAAHPGAPPDPSVVMTTGDCDDHNAKRAPGLAESCDALDNDCDGGIDEAIKNACGGACGRPFDHQPGEACSNGLLGVCARDGLYTCQGDSAVVCDATPVIASGELCGDKKDNDCDGTVDEPDAANATLWYQDCDGDGYAGSTTGAQQSCDQPAKAGACTWTNVVPHPETKSNWDCNDSIAAYSPAAAYGAPPSGSSSYDLNCDGQTLADPNWGRGYEICNKSLIALLNAKNSDCDTSGNGRWDGCVMWKGSDGQYTGTPPKTCPDSSTYKVQVDVDVNPWETTASGWICTFAAVGPVWPCR